MRSVPVTRPIDQPASSNEPNRVEEDHARLSHRRPPIPLRGGRSHHALDMRARMRNRRREALPHTRRRPPLRQRLRPSGSRRHRSSRPAHRTAAASHLARSAPLMGAMDRHEFVTDRVRRTTVVRTALACARGVREVSRGLALLALLRARERGTSQRSRRVRPQHVRVETRNRWVANLTARDTGYPAPADSLSCQPPIGDPGLARSRPVCAIRLLR
jgi:hypothetical protein